MSIHQITEFAAMIAAQSRSFIEFPQPLGDEQLQVCWQATRCRLIDELRRIDACIEEETSPENDAHPNESLWDRLGPLLEEVFATEMLTRVWSGVLAARDRLHPTCGYGAVALNILVLQLKVRQRALRLLVDGAANDKDVQRIAATDRTRRKLERWTDLLLAEMVLRDEVVDYACDARRAREFGVDYFQNQTHTTYHATWTLLIAGMRAAFPAADEANTDTDSLPEDLFRAILACLPVDGFLEDGPSLSLRSTRNKRIHLKSDRFPSDAIAGMTPRITKPRAPKVSRPADGISFSQLRRPQD
ncbi:hypothetical protein [Symmachiella dynata]|nr:hypothetical protein [Symmachiella dynata]